MQTKRNRKNWFMVLGVFVAVCLFTFLVQRFDNNSGVRAANLSRFDPGYIISDYQMSNYNSMNESQIQAFLKSKNSCNDTNIGRATAGDKVWYFSEMSPPRTWHVKDGHFVCMADEVFDGGTAAHIIYRAAQDYRINPQVLIVLLEKEQSLVRDTFPHSQQYRSATGYGCPDTAACSSKYYGLQNQIRNAASLFRTVLDGGWTNYPVGNNYVQYNPNAACGGSVVNIKNRATSALYRYTPYQPNAATLGGRSDGCNAYGNMNFYSFFEDWFGGITWTQSSTRVPDGLYYLQPSKNSGVVAGVPDGESEKDGANVRLFKMNRSSEQQWKITYNSTTDDYTIVNAISGKALDVDGAGVKDGTNIQIWEANGTCAQRWRIVRTSGDSMKLLSACSYKAIDIVNAIVDSGINIDLWVDNGTIAQSWKLEPVNTISEEGVYTIHSKVNEEKVIDISGGVGNAVPGSNVQIWTDNNTGAQRWAIKKTSDGYFVINNLQSRKVIDVAAGRVEDWTNIQVWGSNGTCAQKWKAIKNSDETYTFISACSSKVLDLAASNANSGSNIQIYSANNSKAQRWILKKADIVKNGEYSIASSLSENKVVDIAANQNINGTNIQIYDSNGTNAQKWKITYDAGTDFYTIINPATKKALDVAAAGIWSGTNIQLWSSNGTCAQKWAINENNNGKYNIVSACSNLVLDVKNAEKRNGANVQLWQDNGSAAQKWVLK